ncbi:hypothetical protein DFH09DRAFT_1109874 [Mycena vulgaris]|nr:hypothetical protein DFH09DRAFT_1109874 [Mycena vulgaris]
MVRAAEVHGKRPQISFGSASQGPRHSYLDADPGLIGASGYGIFGGANFLQALILLMELMGSERASSKYTAPSRYWVGSANRATQTRVSVISTSVQPSVFGAWVERRTAMDSWNLRGGIDSKYGPESDCVGSADRAIQTRVSVSSSSVQPSLFWARVKRRTAMEFAEFEGQHRQNARPRVGLCRFRGAQVNWRSSAEARMWCLRRKALAPASWDDGAETLAPVAGTGRPVNSDPIGQVGRRVWFNFSSLDCQFSSKLLIEFRQDMRANLRAQKAG